MYEILFDALLVGIVFFAVMAVRSRDLLKSVIFLSSAAVCTATVFLLLNAPDIAITKVAVEAGLSTMIFIVAIQKTERFENHSGGKASAKTVGEDAFKPEAGKKKPEEKPVEGKP
jgi:uncharacterized MnhB-related membrane protein